MWTLVLARVRVIKYTREMNVRGSVHLKNLARFLVKFLEYFRSNT